APLPPPPSAWAAVGCVAPASRPACGCPGGAGHGVAPGVRLGSLVRVPIRHLGMFSLFGAIVTVTFANWLRLSVRHGIKSQFLCSIEAPFLRPDLGSGGRLAQPRSRLARPKGGPPPEAAWS